MSPTSIYLSSASIIGLMVLTAFWNRRNGWRKVRSGTVRDLFQIGPVWRAAQAGAEPPENRMPVSKTLPASDYVHFRRQLVSLQSALHQQARVVAQTEPALSAQTPR